MITGNNNSSHPFRGSALTDSFRHACMSTKPPPPHTPPVAPARATPEELADPRYIRHARRIPDRHLSAAQYLRNSARPARGIAVTVAVVDPRSGVAAAPYPETLPVTRTSSGDVLINVTPALRALVNARPPTSRTGIRLPEPGADRRARRSCAPPNCLGFRLVSLVNDCVPGARRIPFNYMIHDVLRITFHIVDADPNSRSKLDDLDTSVGLAIRPLLSGGELPIYFDIYAPSWIVDALSKASFHNGDATVNADGSYNNDATLKHAADLYDLADRCIAPDIELLFAYIAAFGFTHGPDSSAAQIILEGHLVRCARRGTTPVLTRETAAAIEDYVSAVYRTVAPSDPRLRKLWEGKASVEARPARNLPLGGTECRPDPVLLQSHTYAAAIDSYKALCQRINPTYITPEGAQDRIRRQQTATEAAELSICVTPNGQANKNYAAIIEEWLETKRGLNVRTKILTPETNESFTAFRSQNRDGHYFYWRLLDTPYVSVFSEHNVRASSQSGAPRETYATSTGKVFIIELHGSKNMPHEVILHHAVEHQLDRILEIVAPYLPALYRQELQRDTPPEISQEALEAARATIVDKRSRAKIALSKAEALEAKSAAAAEIAVDPSSTKAAADQARRDSAKHASDAAAARSLADRHTAEADAAEADLQRMETPNAERLRCALRIADYLVNAEHAPISSEALSCKYLIQPGASYEVRLLRRDPAFRSSLLHSSVIAYLQQFRNIFSDHGRPTLCDIFYPNTGVQHHTGETVRIYPKATDKGYFYRTTEPAYTATLLHHITRRAGAGEVCILQHMAPSSSYTNRLREDLLALQGLVNNSGSLSSSERRDLIIRALNALREMPDDMDLYGVMTPAIVSSAKNLVARLVAA
jgi:hypothetical protein